MTRCVIISGGAYSPIKTIENNDFVIACDKGLEYAKKDGIKPDLVMGDFDSYEGALDTNAPVIRFKCEKDDTDTMLAIRYAVEHKFDEVILYSALGNRLDHAIANLQGLAFAAQNRLKASICSTDTLIYALYKDRISIKRKEGFSLSVFAFSDTCKGVSIEGAKYTLCNATVTNHIPIGVSNEWTDDEVKISVEDGTLLVVLSKL